MNDEEIIKGLQKDYTDDIQAVMNFYQVLDAHCYAQKDQSISPSLADCLTYCG